MTLDPDEILARIDGDAPLIQPERKAEKPFVDLREGDCREVLKELDDNSVDAVVTDPPYGLEFMGKDWDSADGFRRALNQNDAGRDNAFGRTSAKAPEYRTSGSGQKGKPGIGDRPTEWVSNQGWNQFRCATCGHLFHGGSPCACENPRPVKADNRWNVFQQWCETWAVECLRVLKPGGHLLAFGGSRTYHRLASAVEDAGFEIRDQIMWIYGSGFPKSSNQTDDWEGWGTALKPAHEPIVVARKPLVGTVPANLAKYGVGALNIDGCRVGTERREYKGGMGRFNETAQSQGFRPYVNGVPSQSEETFIAEGRWPANVIHDGSDEVLAAFPDRKTTWVSPTHKNNRTGEFLGALAHPGAQGFNDDGSAARFFKTAEFEEDELLIWRAKTILERWNPELANTADERTNLPERVVASALNDAVIWASFEGRQLSDLTGLSTSATPNELRRISEAVITAILSIGSVSSLASPHVKPFLRNVRASVAEATEPTGTTTITISHWKSDGSAAPVTFKCTPQSTEAGAPVSGKRFAYIAKTSKQDRDDGLTTPEQPVVTFATANGTSGKPSSISEGRNTSYKNVHPTVKPTPLMQYLTRLVTPPGGVVLDPFMGSGSTGRGAVLEGFSFIGIEMDAAYYDIADARIAAVEKKVRP